MGHKKGQGTAEYLVLLAIVLIVTLIGIVLLGGFTQSGVDARDTETTIYWAGATPFSINDWAQKGDIVSISITNNLNERIILKNITIGNVNADLGAGWVFSPMSTKNISISGFTACDKLSYDSYDYNVTFRYDSSLVAGKGQIGSKPLSGRCVFDE